MSRQIAGVPVQPVIALAILGGLAACSDGGSATSRESSGSVDADPAVTGIRYLGGNETFGFERATTPRVFVFPRDHASHGRFRTEWWYFTGNLFGAQARHYGFELTFFRVGLRAGVPASSSPWASNDIWMAHFALTDTENESFHAAERLSRGALGLAGAELGPLRIWVEDWSASAVRDGVLRLRAQDGDMAIDLEVDGIDRIVAQGDRGLDPKGPEPGNASHYYSAPRLEARGTIRTVEGSPEAVAGSAWMDREWSTSVLSDGIVGWDWFALQLDDGRDVMYYRLRGADGGTSEFSGGTIATAAGEVERLGPEDVELDVADRWTSPLTGIEYPVAWRLEIPALGLALSIDPYLENQELSLSVRYWEGAVRASGSSRGTPIAGNGYLELAGY